MTRTYALVSVALIGVLMGLGLELAVTVLSAMSLLGAVMALTMKHVQD